MLRAPCVAAAALTPAAPPHAPARHRLRRRRVAAAGSAGPRGGPGGGDDEEEAERLRRQTLEDELRDPGSPVEFLLPRPVRQTALGALAGGAALSLALGLQRAASSPALAAADGATVPGLAVNAVVLAAAVAALLREGDAASERLQRRAANRAAQEAAGARETAALPDGRAYSRLKQVDDAWIVARLERWGAQDNLPSVGVAKGAALQALVRERRPRAVLEVGTFLGYSAIRMAQALPDDGCSVVTVEQDLRYVLSARRFLWQCNQGERAPGEPRVGRRVRVEWGDAAAVLPRLASAGRRFDFLFIDGVPADTLAHLRAAEALLAPGATVVLNNTLVFAKSLAPALEYVRDSSTGKYTDHAALPTAFGWRDGTQDALHVCTWRGSCDAD